MKSTTRYHKAFHGGVVQITTTVTQIASEMVRLTDRVDKRGYIRRKTQEEAEKDPTPTSP